MVDLAGCHFEIAQNDIPRGKDGVLSERGDHLGEGEEIQRGLFGEPEDGFLTACADIEVGAPEADEVDRACHRIGEGGCGGVTGHPVERRLHRPGRNLEGLQEIGLKSDGQSHGDHDGLDVLAPDGVGACGNDTREADLKIPSDLGDRFLILAGDRPVQGADESL